MRIYVQYTLVKNKYYFPSMMIEQNMPGNKAKLFQKILAVQKSLEPVEKSGHNTFHKYSYTTAGDVLLPAQKACNEHGLVMTANVIASKIEPGKAEVTIQLTVCDSETGESHCITAPGYAEDWSWKDNKPTGDKAVYKAVTGATKYAVRTFFCLPSEDDPERTPKVAKADNRGATPAPSTTPSIQAITATTNEMKRLGWSTERGRLYLQNTFGKSSRQQMTEEELKQFLTQLRDMPTPQLQDTRS